MRLNEEEKAMRDGAQGPAVAKAMDLLIRYGEALGAEDFVYTDNIAGVPGSSPKWVKDYYAADGGDYRAVFSRFDLDSDEVVDVPRINGFACHLQGGMDPELWREQGMTEEAFGNFQADERDVADHGIQVLKTCTPYLAGNVPVMGEHCAWMESSAVVFCNSVIGGRTNCEGRESTSAAMLAKRIPNWGFHKDDFRQGQHLIEVQAPVDSIFEWGLLGYYTGGAVEAPVGNTLCQHRRAGGFAAFAVGAPADDRVAEHHRARFHPRAMLAHDGDVSRDVGRAGLEDLDPVRRRLPSSPAKLANASSLMPCSRHSEGSIPPCRWQLNAFIRGTSTTSSESRSKRENTAR